MYRNASKRHYSIYLDKGTTHSQMNASNQGHKTRDFKGTKIVYRTKNAIHKSKTLLSN